MEEERKKEIITIAGAIGSGKSTTARSVARLLAYEHFSSGDLFREIAKERGISIEAINLDAEKQQDIDRKVDQLLAGIGKKKNRMVIDSRLAFHFIPTSYKVYLALDSNEAARRILNHLQLEGRVSQHAETVEEVLADIKLRKGSEQKRYMEAYGIDVTDISPFDLIIDTKENNPEQVVEKIIAGYKKWLSS